MTTQDLQALYVEQCRTNLLLSQILEALQVKPRKKREPGTAKVFYSRIAGIWNQYARESGGWMHQVGEMHPGGARARAAVSRWEENPDPDFWSRVISRITRSAFCRGENQRKWVANFDFLIRPDTAAKVLEGRYDDRAGKPAAQVDL